MVSGNLSLFSTVTPKEDSTVVHLSCALNPNGMSQAQCRAMTLVPARNLQFCCGNSQSKPCVSSDRLCRACIMHSGPKQAPIDFETGLCEFHTLNGQDTPQPWHGYERMVPKIDITLDRRRVPDGEPRPAQKEKQSGAVKHRLMEKTREVEKYASIKPKLTAAVWMMLDDGYLTYRQAQRLARHSNNPERQEYLAIRLSRGDISVQNI